MLNSRAVRWVEHVLLALAVVRLLRALRSGGLQGLVKSALGAAVQGVQRVPGLSGVVDAEIAKEVAKLEDKFLADGDADAHLALPAQGQSVAALLDKVTELKRKDAFGSGQQWAGIYHDVDGHSEVEALQSKVWALFNNSNSLYPGIFKSCRKFEAEIVQMAVAMLHGDAAEGACGLLTSGGTESILLAVLGYRELAKQRGIERPQIVTCSSAHGALDKACHYFGLELVKVAADPKTFRLEAYQVKPLLTPRTIAVYASAPSFPFGTVDPIEDLAALTKARGIGLHVDNCLGGFYLSSLQAAGLYTGQNFDFAVDGVTSISVDVHKYGFAPKGVSVVAFASKELRRLTVHPVTSGLTLYVTPTLQGSRGGGVMAAAWATVLYYGADGYKDLAVRFHALKKKLEGGIRDIPGLVLPVDSDVAIIPIGGDGIDVYAVATLMERKGWSSFTSQNPPLMQLCIGEQHFRVADELLADLAACAREVRENPDVEVTGDAAVYSAAGVLPDSILQSVMKGYIEVTLMVKKKKKTGGAAAVADAGPAVPSA